MLESESQNGEEDGHYDAIVVGSGMGGLATASLLAQIGGKRVLVLESHFKVGGFLHSFRRNGYQWDPGLHYIGDMSDGALTRQCMDLVTGGGVRWHKLNDRFERFVLPEETFEVPSDLAEFERELARRFPAEVDAIGRYFADLARVQRWSFRWFYSKQFRQPASTVMSLGRRLPETVTQEYLDANFNDPALKAILTAQWPDYGMPPGRSAFGVHAIVASDFGGGGYYPIGGSDALIASAVSEIEQRGGAVLARHRVERILVKNNRAYGVEVSTRTGTLRFTAPMVISNAGVATTFGSLIDNGHGFQERERLTSSEPGPSALVLFLGLNDDPRERGFEDCNYWVYDGLDHNRTNTDSAFPPPVLGAYLSFGSLRNPRQEKHSAQIITFSDYSSWSDYSSQPWKQRGADYEAKKEVYADHLLNFIDERLPGVKSLVAYRELGTPLTMQSFTDHPSGQVYGRACTPQRLADKWSIGTSIKGLYLTGTDVVVPGVNSALMIGVMTAGKLLGPGGTARVIHAARSRKDDSGRRRSDKPTAASTAGSMPDALP